VHAAFLVEGHGTRSRLDGSAATSAARTAPEQWTARASSGGEFGEWMSDDKQTRDRFADVVNMTASELRHWLDTDESKQVGQKPSGGGESTGHESGRHILRILGKTQGQYTEDDYAHMRKVVGYVARHSEQRPDGDVRETPWRWSLMNWGHDPEKHR